MLLITGGIGTGTSVEVVSPSGVPLPCSVPPLPDPRNGHTQDGEVACGGGGLWYTLSSCVSLTAFGWIESHHLTWERWGHVSWSSPAGLILMGGDQEISDWTDWTGTELLTNDSSSSSPDFFDLEYGTR